MTSSSAPGHHAGAAGSRRRIGRAGALPPDQRRAAIVAAATPLLRGRGHEVTTREIAEAAGIAEGTIFRAFPTKQAIVDEVLARACDMTDTIALIEHIDRSSPLEDRVRRCAVIMCDQLSSMIDLMITLRPHRPVEAPAGQRPGQRPRDARYDQRHRDQRGRMLAAVTDLLAPDADRLAFPPDRAAQMLRMLALAGTHRMISDGDPLTADEVADVLLHGIIRPGSARGGRPPPTPDG